MSTDSAVRHTAAWMARSTCPPTRDRLHREVEAIVTVDRDEHRLVGVGDLPNPYRCVGGSAYRTSAATGQGGPLIPTAGMWVFALRAPFNCPRPGPEQIA